MATKSQSEFFENLLDHMLEGCQIIDFEWRYRYVNDAVVQHGRKSKEELLGQRMMDVYPGIDQTSVFQTLSHCMKTRTSAKLLNEFKHLDGSKGWFELSIRPVPEGLLIMSLDITEHEQAKKRIQAQLQRLETLREIDVAILGTTDLKLLLDTILRKTVSSLDAEMSVIWLLNPTTLMLEPCAVSGPSRQAAEFAPLQVGDGIIGRAALERRTIAVPDVAKELLPEKDRSFCIEERFGSIYVTPLIAKGELTGALAIYFQKVYDASKDWLGFFETIAGQSAMALDSIQTFEALQRSNIELKLAYDKTIEGWSRALELRDRETKGHTQRVTETTVKLARMADMDEEALVHIRRGALLHDIGKMGIPDAILLKPGKLTDEEWAVIHQHPTYAYELLLPIAFLRSALDIPYCHHEKWDGTGYPRGLRGEQIPLSARLFAVVDVWDALRSERPYRQAWSENKTLEYIKTQVGTHFCPKAAKLFFKLMEQDAKCTEE